MAPGRVAAENDPKFPEEAPEIDGPDDEEMEEEVIRESAGPPDGFLSIAERLEAADVDVDSARGVGGGLVAGAADVTYHQIPPPTASAARASPKINPRRRGGAATGVEDAESDAVEVAGAASRSSDAMGEEFAGLFTAASTIAPRCSSSPVTDSRPTVTAIP